jgi:hypothetical protein
VLPAPPPGPGEGGGRRVGGGRKKERKGSGPGGRKRLRPACADPLNISAPRTATPFLRLLSPHSVFFVNLFLSNKVGSAASC